MAQVLVRDLDESVVEKLKKRAAQNGRSLQAELKAILEAQARMVSKAEARRSAALQFAPRWPLLAASALDRRRFVA